MARNRMIKPEFWEDEEIAKLDFQSRLFYVALWNFADDEGFIKTNPEWLKAKCFPYDKANIKQLLDNLVKIDRIKIHNNIAKIIHFLKHQRIDRPKPSELSTSYRRAIDDASTTKSNIREVNIKEGEGNVEKKNGHFAHPSLEEVSKYCLERKNQIDPQKFFDYYAISGWKKANGKSVLNWKQCVITWEGKENNRPAKAELIQKFQVIGG